MMMLYGLKIKIPSPLAISWLNILLIRLMIGDNSTLELCEHSGAAAAATVTNHHASEGKAVANESWGDMP